MSARFTERCNEELGYVPVHLGERISESDIIFKPRVVSLHRRSIDPLDP